MVSVCHWQGPGDLQPIYLNQSRAPSRWEASCTILWRRCFYAGDSVILLGITRYCFNFQWKKGWWELHETCFVGSTRGIFRSIFSIFRLPCYCGRHCLDMVRTLNDFSGRFSPSHHCAPNWRENTVSCQCSLLWGTDMYLLLNHLKEGSPSTEEDDPSTAILSDCFFMVVAVVAKNGCFMCSQCQGVDWNRKSICERALVRKHEEK